LLFVTPFNVWLDLDDLRPKLVYNNRPDAIIDCISASGKERTFASVVIKFALNQINVKTKPTIFLLDEVMGKLDLNGSVDEFIEILELHPSQITDVLIEEELNKSELIREMIDKYVRSCRNPQKKDVVQEITKIKGRNTITPKNIN
jgi:hypothetical protein